jgi:hypothetical protein
MSNEDQNGQHPIVGKRLHLETQLASQEAHHQRLARALMGLT